MPGPYRATADGQSVGRGAPTPPRACGHMPFPVRLRRGAASPTPCGGCPANDACGKCPGGIYAAPTNRRMICGIQRQTRRGQDPSLQASKSLPPLGEGGPAGPDEGETARQQPFAYNVRAGRARPLRTGGGKPPSQKQKLKKHPHGANHAGAYFLCQYQPNILIRIPAATAEPITPATLGPMACMSR